MKVFKSRFVAYKFFKDGKRIPGLLTVAHGRLLPEFNPITPGYIAGWRLDKQGNLSVFAEHNKKEVATWAKHKGADKVQRIIVEMENVEY